MNNNNLLWLFVLVVVVIVAVGIVAMQPQCASFADGVACEKTTYVPGLALGVPTSQIGFDTIAFKSVDVTLESADVIEALSSWLSIEGASTQRNLVVQIKVRSKKGGAMALGFSQALKDFSDAIAARLGFQNPNAAKTVGNLYWLVFYGRVEQ